MTPLHKFSEARKQYIVKLLDRLFGGPLPYVCGNNQDVMVFARKQKDGSSVVLAVNLISEPIGEFRLRAPNAKSLSVLAPDGTWQMQKFSRDGDWLSIPLPIAFYETKVFKLR